MAYIIIGGKKYNSIKLDNIIDSFPQNARCNFGIPNMNSGSKCCDLIVNCHVSKNLKRGNLSRYTSSVSKEHLVKVWNYYKGNKYRKCYVQRENPFVHFYFNKYLKTINCPIQLRKNPRIGYEMIYNLLVSNNSHIYVTGFSLDEDNLSWYNNNLDNNHPLIHHDVVNEKLLLKWFHDTNKVDATMCLLVDKNLPTFNCIYFKPKLQVLRLFLKEYGICILENYFSKETINNIDNDFDKIFEEQKALIDILDKEDCSNDERIFHAERYGKNIKMFSDDPLFNSVARTYNVNFNKKTLINKILFEEGKRKNSGAGWHRDNHVCQFKAIMYLSDVTEKNGNFQFITNSSRKHIGYPKPRTENYNTRFADDTIEQLLKQKKNIKHDIIGKKGTVILVDTTYIHRGNIIEEGERRAITQYFF